MPKEGRGKLIHSTVTQDRQTPPHRWPYRRNGTVGGIPRPDKHGAG